MDPRRAVVLLGLLLLLLTDRGQAEGPGDLDGDQDLAVSERPSSKSPSSSAWAQPCARGPQPPEVAPAPAREPRALCVFHLPRPSAAGRRRPWPSTGHPAPQGPPAHPAPGHGETWPEPSLPVPAPEVWQKRPGAVEQAAAESPSWGGPELPVLEPGCTPALREEVTRQPSMCLHARPTLRSAACPPPLPE